MSSSLVVADKKRSRLKEGSKRSKPSLSHLRPGTLRDLHQRPQLDTFEEPTALIDHLIPFQPPGLQSALQSDQVADLEKLRSRLFGIPLQAGINFSLRLQHGCNPHVPIIVKDIIEWLVHYLHTEEKSVTSLLTEEPDKGLLERLIKKYNKDAQSPLSPNIHAATVWNVLKSYIGSLPETPITFECYSALLTANSTSSLGEILAKLPQENKSLMKRLLWLLSKFRDQTRNATEESLIISAFSQLLFNVNQPEIAAVPSSAVEPFSGSRDKRDKLLGIVIPDSSYALTPKRELLVSALIHSFLQFSDLFGQYLVDSNVPDLLEGEEILHRLHRVRVGSLFSDVNLWLTAYRIILQLPQGEELSIPTMSIRHAEMLVATKKKKSKTISLLLKDYRTFTLEIETPFLAWALWDVLACVLLPKSVTELYVFSAKPTYFVKDTDGWGIFDVATEFERQGIFSNPNNSLSVPTTQNSKASSGSTYKYLFRLSKINATYEVPTYPATWLVPSQIDDTELRKTLSSRLRQRIPIITWGKSGGAGVLLRADEPDLANLSDAKDAKSLAKAAGDCRLLDLYTTGCQGRLIVDSGASRTYKYAYAGSNWQMKFLESFNNKTLADKYALFMTHLEAEKSRRPDESDSREEFWYPCLRNVLGISSSIVNLLVNKQYAILLTHSHGNDIDFVLSSLVQIMVDGYYRTIRGLAVLIEKDWSSFGYDYSRKLGHQQQVYDDETQSLKSGDSSSSSDNANQSSVTSSSTSITPINPEMNPFFDLFIEAIWQMMVQFPLHFEFNEEFLLSIIEAAYSCRFGTFLANTEKEREAYIKDKTASFWGYIHHRLEHDPEEYINVFYEPDTHLTTLDPRYEPTSLKLWYAKHIYHHQYAEMVAVNALVEKAVRDVNSREVEPINLNPSGITSPRRDSPKTSAAPTPRTARKPEDEHSVDYHKSDFIDLDLSARGLKLIPRCVVTDRNSGRLQGLDFSRNELNFFPSDVLRLTRLKSLNLSRNPLGDISRDHFFMMGARLVYLQQLDLTKTGLVFLPDDVTRLANLRMLSVKSNSLTELPPSISSFKHLEILDARRNKLSNLPPSVFKLPSLRVLALGDNSISIALEESSKPKPSGSPVSSLSDSKMAASNRSSVPLVVPVSFKQLSKLSLLDWRGNALASKKEIPPSIFELPVVTSLYLDANDLETLNPLIGNLKYLTYLNISDNKLTNLPDEITNLANLKRIAASSNKLWCLPYRISQLPLTSIDLSHNRFTEIPPPILSLTELQTLDMSSNTIKYIPSTLVEKVTSLEYLNFADNMIKTLDNLPSIRCLTKLKYLNLQGNQFERLPLELAHLVGILTRLELDTSPNTRIVFPPREILVKSTDVILKYLSERANTGETDNRMNLIVLGDASASKSLLLKKLTKSTALSSKKDNSGSTATLNSDIRHVGAASMLPSLVGQTSQFNETNTRTSASLNSGAVQVASYLIDRWEWSISTITTTTGPPQLTTSLSTSDTGKEKDKSQLQSSDLNTFGILPVMKEIGTSGGSSILGLAAKGSQSVRVEARALVWDINLSLEETRAFLHPSFLNDRAVYIVVWDNSQNKENLLSWVEVVVGRGKKVPFIVVAIQSADSTNSKDLLSSIDHEIAKKYPSHYRGLIASSSGSKGDIKSLISKIEEIIVDLHFLRDSHPASYFTMERFLLSSDLNPPLMGYDYFTNIARECGIKDMKKLMKHLMSLGIVLHLNDHPHLSNILVLDPLWPFNFLNQLAISKGLPENGVVNHSDLVTVFMGDKKYPKSVLPTLLAFTQAMGLSYPFTLKTEQLRYNVGDGSSAKSETNANRRHSSAPRKDPVLVPLSRSKEAPTASTSPSNLSSSGSSSPATPQSKSPALSRVTANKNPIVPGYHPSLLTLPSFFGFKSWIPIFCSETRPASFSQFWPKTVPSISTISALNLGPNTVLTHPHAGAVAKDAAEIAQQPPILQTGRRYIFPVIPTGLLFKLLMRLLSLCKVELFWRSGCLLTSESTGETIYISLNMVAKAIKIMVRTTSACMLAADVFETLDNLRREMKLEPTSINVPCPHCLAENNSHPWYFSLDECERASIEDNSVLYCHEVRPIYTKYTVPDLSLQFISHGRRVKIEDLELIKIVGEGAAAEVFLGKLDGEFVAVKRLRVLTKSSKDSSDIMVSAGGSISKSLAEFRREVRFLSSLKHPSIAAFRGIVLNPPCIIQEFCGGGNLFEYCHKTKERDNHQINETTNDGKPQKSGALPGYQNLASKFPISWPIRLKIALDISEGMALLHALSPPITHRDLKSPNILLAAPNYQNAKAKPPVPASAQTSDSIVSQRRIETEVKLNQNALSKTSDSKSSSENDKIDPKSAFARAQSSKIQKLSTPSKEKSMAWTSQEAVAKVTDFGLTGLTPTVVGREVDNPVWLAPEVMTKGIDYDERADVYSFAVIMYELLTGKEYFGNFSFMTDIERAVLEGQRPPLPASKDRRLPRGEPFTRDSSRIVSPTSDEMQQVPEYIELIKQCWADNPSDRPTFRTISSRLISIIQQYPDIASQITLPPSPQLETHSISTSNSVLEGFHSLTGDLLPNTKLIEYLDVGESVTACTFQDNQVWIGFNSGTMSSYSTLPAKSPEDSSSSTPTSPMSARTPVSAPPSPNVPLASQQASASPVQDLAVPLVASASDQSIAIAAPTEREIINPLLLGTFRYHKASVISVVPFLSNVCSVASDRQISLWGTTQNAKLRSMIQIEPLEEPPTAMMAMNNILLVVSKSGSLRAHENAQTKWKERKYGAGPLYCILHIPGASQLWLGGDKKIIRVDRTLKVIDSFFAHEGTVNCMCVRSGLVWSGSADKTIRVWDATTGELQGTLIGHKDEVTCLLAVGKQIWSCAKDRSIIIWDSENFCILKEIQNAHNDTITCLTLVRESEVWSGSADRTVGRWSVCPSAGVGATREDTAAAMNLDITSQVNDSEESITTKQSKSAHPHLSKLRKHKKQTSVESQLDDASGSSNTIGGSSSTISAGSSGQIKSANILP